MVRKARGSSLFHAWQQPSAHLGFQRGQTLTFCFSDDIADEDQFVCGIFNSSCLAGFRIVLYPPRCYLSGTSSKPDLDQRPSPKDDLFNNKMESRLYT